MTARVADFFEQCFYWLVISFFVSLAVALLVHATTLSTKFISSVIWPDKPVIETTKVKAPPVRAPEKIFNPAPIYQARNTITDEIMEVFGSEGRLALSVAKAESGLNPQAVNYNTNGTKDLGVFQINDCHYFSDADRLDWRKNIRLAKWLRDTYGWTAWVAYNNGSYRQYL